MLYECMSLSSCILETTMCGFWKILFQPVEFLVAWLKTFNALISLALENDCLWWRRRTKSTTRERTHIKFVIKFHRAIYYKCVAPQQRQKKYVFFFSLLQKYFVRVRYLTFSHFHNLCWIYIYRQKADMCGYASAIAICMGIYWS